MKISDSIQTFLNHWIVNRIIFVLFLVFLLGLFLSIPLIYGPLMYFKVLGLVLVALASVFVFYLGLYPAQAANRMVRALTRISSSRVIRGFWTIYNHNKFRRELILLVLAFLIILTVFAEIYLFIKMMFLKNNVLIISELIYVFLAFVLCLALIFFVDYLRLSTSPMLCKHSKSKNAKKLLDTLAITAGIKAPRLKILKSNYMIAYSEYKYGSYIVYLSVGMLANLRENNINAVLAHEVSKIKSGSVKDHKYIVLYLYFYKALAGGFFVLFLGLFSYWFFLVWTGLLIIFSLERYGKTLPFESNEHSPIYLLSMLLLPNLALMNFVSCFVFYLLAYQEVFLADLQAVLLTRYPEGMYRALITIKEQKPTGVHYGARLDIMYFSGERIYTDIPMPQPSIASRQKLLERLESSLGAMKTEAHKKNLKCLLCHHPMQTKRVDSHYLKKNVEIDQCPNCLSVWFDDSELLYIADLRTLCDKEKQDKRHISYSGFESYLMCPHCGVSLHKFPTHVIPAEIGIWACPSCEGNFLLHDDIYKFGMHKLGLKTKEK